MNPGTEFAPAAMIPAGVLDAALECAAKEHLEVVANRRSPNGFEANFNRETLNKATTSRNECSRLPRSAFQAPELEGCGSDSDFRPSLLALVRCRGQVVES